MNWTSSSTSGLFVSTCSSETGLIMYAGNTNKKLFKSTDQGSTWTIIYTALDNIIKIRCNYNGTKVFFLDRNNNTYYSTNSGLTPTVFSNKSFLFTDICMTNDSTPTLFAYTTPVLPAIGPGYQSTNNATWSLFLSGNAGPFNSIECGNTITSSAGYIYLNGNNTKIYYSNNGGTNAMSPYTVGPPPKPLYTTVNCGKIVCAKNSPNIVMTIYNSDINYSSDSFATYSTKTLPYNISDIVCSYDGTSVAVALIDGNIYLSTTGPGGTYNLTTGYITSLLWKSIAGNKNLSSMVATYTTTNNIYYRAILTSYNYYGIINTDFEIITFELRLTFNGTNNMITVTGTINYSANYTNSTLVAMSTYNSADNILNSTSKPYFTTSGISFIDNTNNINYNIRDVGSSDVIYTNIYSGTPFSITSENLSVACLLENSNVLTTNGYTTLLQLNKNDIILSENKEYKIKNIIISKVEKRNLPYMIPKGTIINNKKCSEDLYISPGHGIKIEEEKFKLPKNLGFKQLSYNEFLKLNCTYYFHIELEGNNRRINTLTANEIVLESYSSEDLKID